MSSSSISGGIDPFQVLPKSEGEGEGTEWGLSAHRCRFRRQLEELDESER